MVLSETVRVSRLSLEVLRTELPADCLIPPMIPSAVGTTRWTSVRAAQSMDKLSEIYRAKCAPYKVSPESFRTYTQYAIGEMISEIQAKPPSASDWLPCAVKVFDKCLRNRLSKSLTDLTEIVPCDLFDVDQRVPAFSVGPVQFSPRDCWLAAQPAGNRTSLISQVWARELKVEDIKPTNQPGGVSQTDALSVRELVEHIGPHLWIALVPFTGHDVTQAHVKGPLFVELALDFLSLFMDAASGRRLLHPGIQGRLSETSVSLNKDGWAFGGWKFNKPGVGGLPDAAQKLLRDKKCLLDAAGAILNRYSSDSDAGKISRLVDRWVNALHWYGRAMRQDLDFMALADYGDALDILTSAGGNNGNMVNYCATALAVNKEKQITEDGLSLVDVISRIYNLGRSAIRHGNQFGLMSEFGRERALGHELIRIVLLMVTEPLADIVGANHKMLTLDKNEVRAFLRVLSERRKNSGP